MNTAIHFGAGNIGRGFIGKLLADAGIHVTFADVNATVVDRLIQDQAYQVKVVGEDCVFQDVNNVTAMYSNKPEIVEAMAKVDLITTAVGPTVLEIISSSLAKAIELRCQAKNTTALNIIACENMVRGTTFLKEKVYAQLSESARTFADQYIGFVDSAVDRIVPPAEASDNPLDVTVESFSEWIVDQTQFVGDIPNIPGMEKTDNLMAFVERKLFTLNTGHCITAYLGCLNGVDTIREAIEREDIRSVVKQAMQESGEVLINRYGFDREAHSAYIEKILGRFANPYLLDEVDRVGRQPLRKLGANDRLIKPLLGTIEYNTANDAILQGVAAALKYNNADDPQSVELQQDIQELGVEAALAKVSGLEQDGEIVKKVAELYQAL